MRCRNRSTGPDSVLTEFHPFTRLLIELRYTIWHLTLQPRVVEIEFQWKEEYGINNEDKLYASYYSRIPLPVALKVCRDSRNAVLPFYPLCFASFLSRPKIRFNLFFDTLYIDDTFGKHLFELLGNLTPIEMAGLQNMAISDLAGSNYYEDDDKGHKYWARLGTLIEKIFGLKNILTVHSLPSILRHNYMAAMKQRNSARAEIWYQVSVEYSASQDPGMQLLEHIPYQVAQRLAQRLGLKAKEMPVAGHGSVHRGRGDWVDKRTRPVFGWN